MKVFVVGANFINSTKILGIYTDKDTANRMLRKYERETFFRGFIIEKEMNKEIEI